MSVIFVPSGDSGLPVRGVRRSSSPSLSLVVASGRDRALLETALDRVLPVAMSHGVEVLVVRADPPARLAELARTYTGVRFVVAPPGSDRVNLLSLGMSETSGHVVALTDDEGLIQEDWAELLAHRGGDLRPGPGLTRDGSPVDWQKRLLDAGAVKPGEARAPHWRSR
jgi:hypothetical protein